MNFTRPQYKYNADPANKPKLQARAKVAYAIASGRVVRQPCDKCGASKTHAHHHDYSKPFEIQWLCSPCHGKEHRSSHCKRGHPLIEENLYINPNSGRRSCLQCQRDFRREYFKINPRILWRRSKCRPIVAHRALAKVISSS